MPRVISLGLSALNILHLNAIVERGVNWRQRQRAKTLILLDQGLDAMISVIDRIAAAPIA